VNCAKVLPQPARAFERGIAALADSHGCFAVFIGEMHDPHAAFPLLIQIVDGICQSDHYKVRASGQIARFTKSEGPGGEERRVSRP